MSKASIDGKTQLMGLIGWPVEHSFSPAMHNAAAAELGLNWVYLPMPVHPQALGTAMRGLPALGFKGFNVTVPHKQAIIPMLDDVEQGARIIGAVNTVVISLDPERSEQPWHLVGHNTDWLGFLADLKALQVNVKGRDCLVLGAGGSARAIVYALAQAGANIILLARRTAQAEQLAAELSSVATIDIGSLDGLSSQASVLDAPLIVNSTPLGMSPKVDQSIWSDEFPFPSGTFIYDLVYNPWQTRLMQQASAAQCPCSNGLGMLLHQGALAFEMWTGHKPNLQTMEVALKAASAH